MTELFGHTTSQKTLDYINLSKEKREEKERYNSLAKLFGHATTEQTREYLGLLR
jgi:hypothetical protein